jgi:SpoVK/Ycf46/Vps4 family AAA+-type ATPase
MLETLMNNGFQNSLDHLLAEIKRIEMKLQLQVMRLRQENNQPGKDEFRGLYISENEIDTITGSPPLTSDDNLTDDAAMATLYRSIGEFEAEIATSKQESLRRGLNLRLHNLERLFHLSAPELDALLICLLPDLDLKYQRLYAYLQNDATKKSPTVDLVLRLLQQSFAERISVRSSFSPEAPLIKYHLLRIGDNQNLKIVPLMTRSLQVDERITNYLLEIDQVDARLSTFSFRSHSETKLSDVVMPDDIKDRLHRLAMGFKEEPLICYFQGAHGVGKHTAAEAICYELGVPLFIVDVNRMTEVDTPLELLIRLVFREGRLQNAALFFDNCDVLFSGETGVKSAASTIITELEDYPWWIFFTGELNLPPKGALHNRPHIIVEFPAPSYLERKQLWERQWNDQQYLASDIDFNDLASKFRLSGGQIRDASASAKSLALWRTPEKGLVTMQDLYLACRRQSGHRLKNLAHQIYPKYEWNDIVLPKDSMEQLIEICTYVKYYHTVYDDWGFGRKVVRGKGLNVLFAGPSGTGKTMAAEIMANELGIDLYKIDLSAIVSKYIGETEKNLDRIFKEGQTANAILFFDEADALFGKRSEVRDSHDRYANIEIAYLLQKMEDYDGVVILATNLRKNLDEAFARRMHFTVDFPVPEEPDRQRIWQSIFPTEAPLTHDIDFSFLARQFKITGGNIKNIAVSAAFLAAQDGGCITMEDLIRATKREYQKMGKLCTEGDFAGYFELVKG